VKARILVDKLGREILKFRRKVHGLKEYQVPPQAAQDIDFKGRIWVEAYFVDGEGFTYVDFPNKKDGKINPLTLDDRDFMQNEFIKAKKRAGENWKQHLPTIIAFGSFLIIIVLLIVNWQGLAEPLLKMADTQAGYQKTQQEKDIEVLRLIEDIRAGKQTVRLGFNESGT
jgi:hypothetical protein